jgi:SP family facilitated glucose transporter-like MFS transporter 1
MRSDFQFSGIVAIFYYSTQFFIGAGVPEGSAQYATLGVGAIMVTMTLVTIPLMDRLGRRTLHLVGLLGILVFSVLITVFLGSSSTEDGTPDGVMGTLIIIATFGFVIFFALGPGSIPWLITGELFEQVRPLTL